MAKANVTDHNNSGILIKTLENLNNKLGPSIKDIKVERLVIGIFFTGVKLSSGHGGICFTPIKEIPEAVCCPSSASVMPSSGKFQGQNVSTVLMDMWHGNPLNKSIGIAIMNALSSFYWDLKLPQNYVIEKCVNAFNDIQIPDSSYVVIIGALVPILRILKQQKRPFSIVELDPRTLKEDELKFYVPVHEAPAAIRKADIAVITGTTLINDTLENILSHAKPGANIMLVGPTASMLPEAFFDRGVKTIGGIIVTKPDELLDTISEGGSGYHFFGKSAERVVIKKREVEPVV